MDLNASQPSDSAGIQSTLEIQRSLHLLDRKNWWHWLNTVLVIMVLTGAIAALPIPKALSDSDLFSNLQIELAIRGLLGVVLIFNIYMLYQQYLLGQARSRLSRQIVAAAEERIRAETIREFAILDPLTGLFSRRFIEERLPIEIARVKRNGYPLIIVLFDLDNFTAANHRYGRPAGDLALKEFARQLSKATRGSDIVARWGGDEFLALLVECPPEKIDIVLSRVRDFEIATVLERIPVSSSHGWAQCEMDDTGEALIQRAAQALHEDKSMRLAHAPQA